MTSGGSVLALYPPPAQERPLAGLYLDHDVRRLGHARAPFVYTNFIVSLDGRIALPRPSGNGMGVPRSIANPRDWRLFQELAVQADVIVTSSGHLRETAAGRVRELVEVYDKAEFRDIADWRGERGLSPYPDYAVMSRDLDFPIAPRLLSDGRRVIVATTAAADPVRMRALEEAGAEVFLAGEEDVAGSRFIDGLAGRGYGIIYSAAGPRVHHTLLADGVIDRLYLTTANRLLGGEVYDPLVSGSLLGGGVSMTPASLCLDLGALDGAGQLLAMYERDT